MWARSPNGTKKEPFCTLRTPGYFGKHASVAYFDFSKDKYCLTEKYHHDTYIGCFPDEEPPSELGTAVGLGRLGLGRCEVCEPQAV